MAAALKTYQVSLPALLVDPKILAGNPDKLLFVKVDNNSILLVVRGGDPRSLCM